MINQNQKVCLLVTGPNCSGKTTTVNRVEKAFPGADIHLIYADTRDKFKCPISEMEEKLTDIWLSHSQVVIAEGTRINTPLMRVAARNRAARVLDIIIITRMRPEVMKAHLQARCEKKGKTFRADHWNTYELEYEGSRRYPSAARKYGFPHKLYEVGMNYEGCDEMFGHLVAKVGAALGLGVVEAAEKAGF